MIRPLTVPVAGPHGPWVDARFGPLGPIQSTRLSLPHPDWWLCFSVLARTPIGNPFSTQIVQSSGASLDPTEAYLRAFGEGIERYSALTATYRTVRATPRETGIADRLPVCAPDEPCPPSLCALPIDAPRAHVVVRRLCDDRELLAPAELVHLNFAPEPADLPMTVPISTGTAFQRTLLAALWAGWCEVVERDALMCLWWCRSAAPEIVCDGGLIPDSLAERLERTKIAGLKVCFFDMTTDILIPSVVCIVIAPRYPYLVVTAASHHDPLRACTKALDENVMVRYVLDSHTRERRPPTLPPGNVRARIDHADWYARRQYHPEFKFLFERDRPRVAFAAFASQERWAVPEDMNALKQFARAREREGLTLLWSDITAPDATDLGRVVKVIVPECVPMSLDRNVRWLGTPRLLRRAAFATPHIAAFNPFPHPFP